MGYTIDRTIDGAALDDNDRRARGELEEKGVGVLSGRRC